MRTNGSGQALGTMDHALSEPGKRPSRCSSSIPGVDNFGGDREGEG